MLHFLNLLEPKFRKTQRHSCENCSLSWKLIQFKNHSNCWTHWFTDRSHTWRPRDISWLKQWKPEIMKWSKKWCDTLSVMDKPLKYFQMKKNLYRWYCFKPSQWSIHRSVSHLLRSRAWLDQATHPVQIVIPLHMLKPTEIVCDVYYNVLWYKVLP